MIGDSGSGKSTLINNIIAEDYFALQSPFVTTPVRTVQHVQRVLLINNCKYRCIFIEPHGDFCTDVCPFYFLRRLLVQILGNA